MKMRALSPHFYLRRTKNKCNKRPDFKRYLDEIFSF